MVWSGYLLVLLSGVCYWAAASGTDRRFIWNALIAHWGDWTDGTCSRTCGVGMRARHRPCLYMGVVIVTATCLFMGGTSTDTEHCHHYRSCASWSSWSSGTCDVTCGTGSKSQFRHCSTGDAGDCAGSDRRTVTCHGVSCPQVDGQWSTWTTWSNCPASCGPGTATRSRSCTNPAPANNGWDCFGNSTDTLDCVANCATWSEWFPGPCSVTCGSGIMERLHRCSSGYEYDCSGPAIDRVACTRQPCV